MYLNLGSLGFTWVHLVLLGLIRVDMGDMERDIFPISRDPSDLITTSQLLSVSFYWWMLLSSD